MTPQGHPPLDERRPQEPAKIKEGEDQKEDVNGEVSSIFKKIGWTLQNIDTRPKGLGFGDKNKEDHSAVE